ncbi:MAG: TetR/AcrR family transcriptional regulator [Deltaproteobacteria bacterium]|nr:TetR/AcrR family transcriptional regulator [Deltaproteobacteria bacterium]
MREKAERREAIVAAAEVVFVRDGYVASTMGLIANEAEGSKGTLYLYFESKDDLRSAIAERWVGRLVDRLLPKLEVAKNGIDGVAAVLEAYDEHFAVTPRHCRMTISWLAGDGPPGDTRSVEGHRRRVGELVALVVGQLVRGQEDGTVRKDVDPSIVAMELWGSFLGVQLVLQNREHVEARSSMSIAWDQLPRTFRQIKLDGLRPQPANPSEHKR